MLIDFGIARWVNKEEKGVTAVGTMGYAPPELFGGNVEPRSDIYSLGSTMFHLLTGADPQNNPLLIFDFNKNPRPRQINSQISDQMEQILMRSVEYNVEGRFSSAAEFREVLIAHLDAIRTGRLTFGVTQGVSATPFVGTQLVFCGFCGQKIVGSDMFCPFCGAKQPQAQGSTPLPSFDTPKLTAKLLVISTNDLDAPTYGLDKDSNLLGRRDPMSNIFPEVDLSKYDPQTKISRRHARIWREVDTFMIEDLGSSNGTVLISTVNEMNKLLPHTPKVLTHGDKVKLGDTILHFVVG
jgi:serine/threonine-protein kinase